MCCARHAGGRHAWRGPTTRTARIFPEIGCCRLVEAPRRKARRARGGLRDRTHRPHGPPHPDVPSTSWRRKQGNGLHGYPRARELNPFRITARPQKSSTWNTFARAEKREERHTVPNPMLGGDNLDHRPFPLLPASALSRAGSAGVRRTQRAGHLTRAAPWRPRGADPAQRGTCLPSGSMRWQAPRSE